MARLGIAPSKKMGQNFLIDENFLDYILRVAKVKPSDHILEVGPGFGALTGRLLKTGAPVTAIELDRKLAAYLRGSLAVDGLTLIEGDACRINIPGIYGDDTPFRLISNLPYSAGTIVVANMLDLKTPPTDMLIMLQKEVAERFAASCGTSEYSALTVRIQALYQVEILKTIPPEVFFPQPEIDSCILHLISKKDQPSMELRKTLSRLVRTAFAHRRKKMMKQVASVFGGEETVSAMNLAEVDPDIRAERVTCEQFLKMASHLMDLVGDQGKSRGSEKICSLDEMP